MSYGMTITGTNEVVVNLKRFDDTVIKKIQNSLNNGAKRVADRARVNAPLGPTGNLKRSIGSKSMPIDQPRYPLVAIAVVDRKIAPHAHLVEYGARGGKMPARPFLRPAFDNSRAEIEAMINNALKGAVRIHA